MMSRRVKAHNQVEEIGQKVSPAVFVADLDALSCGGKPEDCLCSHGVQPAATEEMDRNDGTVAEMRVYVEKAMLGKSVLSALDRAQIKGDPAMGIVVLQPLVRMLDLVLLV